MRFKKDDVVFSQFDSKGLTAYVPVRIINVYPAALHMVYKVKYEDGQMNTLPEGNLHSVDDLKNIKF